MAQLKRVFKKLNEFRLTSPKTARLNANEIQVNMPELRGKIKTNILT